MKRGFLLLTLILTLKLQLPLYAQQAGYWQQSVDYDISVTLNDVEHTLDGKLDLRYTNNSPNTLNEIWFHLWPNAYRDLNTAFARQKAQQGATDFLFAKKEDRGYIENLMFQVDGEAVTLTLDPENPDIGKITLNKPLASGQTIRITTPFMVKLPYCFSRLGHVGQQYQITQWYPKPAVYDAKGWHAIPYLDQGEFYSEFGNFHVTITVPKNYVVGGSGDLLTASEVKWLDSLSSATMKRDWNVTSMEFPSSSTQTKTLEYSIKNAHDFAWFADKRFNVIRNEVILPESGRKVTTYAYFPDKHGKNWMSAADYVGRAVLFYSDHVGEYPWNTAQAVDGTLEVEGAGGMEYPTITVIAGNHDPETLDNIITHEVGHNWFYGILGSNEREHAWMDEGINSFYENRYMDTYYERSNSLGIPAEVIAFFGGDTSSVDQTIWHFNQIMQCQNRYQPVELHAAEYTPINYGLDVYMQTAYFFRYLEDVLGRDEYDRIMHLYFDAYKFKHPYPEDIQALFERETGEQFGWFFTALLQADRGPDYKVHHLQKAKTAVAVTVTNTSDIPAAFSIAIMSGDSVLRTDWFRGFTGSQTVFMNIDTAWDVTALHLDHRKYIPETNRENNAIKTSGLFKTMEPVQVKLLGGLIDNSAKTTIGFTPLVGWNNHDKWMLGIGVWNSTLPTPLIDYVAAPMYSIATSSFVGQGSIGLNLYPDNGPFDRIRLSESLSSYTFTEMYVSTTMEDRALITPKFLRLQTKLEMDLHQNSLRKKLLQTITLRSVWVQEEDQFFAYDINGDLIETLNDSYLVFEGAYRLKRSTKLFPHQLDLTATGGEGFGRIDVTYQTLVHYPKSDKGISIRAFAGMFLTDDPFNSRYNYTLSGANGTYDPLYDEIFLSRNTTNGFVSNQMRKTSGFFKVPVYTYEATSDTYLTALNLQFAIPKVPLVELFADFGYFESASDVPFNPALAIDGFQYDAGVMVSLPYDIFSVYFPIVMSDELEGVFAEDAPYSEKISFMLTLNRGNVFELMRKLGL